MSRWSRLAGLGLLVLLSACAQPTSPVAPAGPLDFDTDARVLRGLWAGRSADGHRLLIDAHPSDPNELGYAVEGTFRLDDLEPVLFSGGVRADVRRAEGAMFLQTSPEYAPFDAVSSDGLWQLLGDAPAGSPPRFELILGGVSDSYTFAVSAPTPTALAGTFWTLETLGGEPVVAGTEITLEFTDQRFGGSGGCNGYGAPYLATPATIKIIDGVLFTARLCETPAGVMAQEETYVSALGEVTTYRLTADRLALSDNSGTLKLVFSR